MAARNWLELFTAAQKGDLELIKYLIRIRLIINRLIHFHPI